MAFSYNELNFQHKQGEEMNFLDDLIQNLFDIIDHLFWFSPEVGPRKLKKFAVLNALLAILLAYCLLIKISIR